MNVIFHTATALCISILLTDTGSLSAGPDKRRILATAACVFAAGIISHGLLDYMPHHYPLNSKLDVILSLFVILMTTWCAKKLYRPILLISFIGSILPDIIDLSSAILNKHLGTNIPIASKLFPWHWPVYSGSIYRGDYTVSIVNHMLVVAFILIACWCRRKDAAGIFSNNVAENRSII